MNPAQLAALIDHTLLRPDATRRQVETLCREAAERGFHAVCVNPFWVEAAVARLADAKVAVCSVAGFPLGATRSETKAEEARRAIGDGAREIDMAMNIGALKSGDETTAFRDIEAVRLACGKEALLKVILECGALAPDEKTRAARLAVEAGADFVKTSTGFGPGGATLDDVRLLRATVGSRIGVKASGGIRDRRAALAMIEAGANRIGTSSGVAILDERP